MKLKSEYGNAIKIADNPSKQRRLKEQGYTEITETSAKKTKEKTEGK